MGFFRVFSVFAKKSCKHPLIISSHLTVCMRGMWNWKPIKHILIKYKIRGLQTLPNFCWNRRERIRKLCVNTCMGLLAHLDINSLNTRSFRRDKHINTIFREEWTTQLCITDTYEPQYLCPINVFRFELIKRQERMRPRGYTKYTFRKLFCIVFSWKREALLLNLVRGVM